MMERTVFPDHVKVEEDGGRSLSSIPPERITLVRSALESSNETPVAIPGCHWQWPFDLVYRNRPCLSPDLPLANVRLLVVGSTLNSAVIDVPDSILDAFHCCNGTCHHGSDTCSILLGDGRLPFGTGDDPSNVNACDVRWCGSLPFHGRGR